MSGKKDCAKSVRATRPVNMPEPRNSQPPSRIRLQIIHRNRMFRDCLSAALNADYVVDVVDVERLLAEEKPAPERLAADVVLIDASLPDKRALEIIQGLRQRNESVRILAVVSNQAKDMLADCIVAGAHGCIYEEASLQDLRAGIQSVTSVGSFCSQDMLHTVFSQFAHLARETSIRSRLGADDLTTREVEILQLISVHLGNKQIAKRLSISLHTVKNHVHNILEKLELTTRFEAVDYARQRQWISEPNQGDPMRARGNQLPRQ